MKKSREFHTFRGYQLQKDEQKQMTASMEDYLEMIYRLSLEDGYIRPNQLADQLNVQAPSVTKVVQKLTSLGLLDYQKYGLIQLTDKGKAMGSFLLNRHVVIENFLRIIGVEDESILRDTEMIEHHLSLNAVQKIKLLYQFIKLNPGILKQFNHYKAAEQKKDHQ